MKKDNLQRAMKANRISMTELAMRTGIPLTTLRRIMAGKVKRVKKSNMIAIAKALNVSVETIFEVPSTRSPLEPIRPEQAGEPGLYNLSGDESFLIFWYQNVTAAVRNEIYEIVKTKYTLVQKELAEKSAGISNGKNSQEDYEQLSMFSTSQPSAKEE